MDYELTYRFDDLDIGDGEYAGGVATIGYDRPDFNDCIGWSVDGLTADDDTCIAKDDPIFARVVFALERDHARKIDSECREELGEDGYAVSRSVAASDMADYRRAIGY